MSPTTTVGTDCEAEAEPSPVPEPECTFPTWSISRLRVDIWQVHIPYRSCFIFRSSVAYRAFYIPAAAALKVL